MQRLRLRAQLAEVDVELEQCGHLGVSSTRDVEEHRRRSVVANHETESCTAVRLIHLTAGEPARESIDDVAALEPSERIADLQDEARAIARDADSRAFVV